MQIRFIGQWLVLPIIIAATSLFADESSNEVLTAQSSLQKTKAELQEQGFKTELTQFNFAPASPSLDWEKILETTSPDRNTARAIIDPRAQPELMEATGADRAIVVWKQDFLRGQTPSGPDASYEVTWDDFADRLSQRQSQMDAACVALQTGDIRFNLDASGGSLMLLRHLPLVKLLTQMLNDRALLALHEGKLASAWTNLLAATRLVSAWNPEPVELSHRLRMDNAKLVFAATWQALQTNGWTDAQLARLQHEWESVDFLSRLTEVQAFRRACDVDLLEHDESQPPPGAVAKLEEERRLLLFSRDREIEYRHAVQAKTWLQMRSLPGVTNEVAFQPNIRNSRFGMDVSSRRMRMGLRWPGITFLAQAAEAEAERNVVITALALERFRAKYQRYPETLQALAPEFLSTAPVDFANGEPLHYQVTPDGHFLLYSVGLDGADNQGKIQIPPARSERFARWRDSNLTVPECDIVWPLPAPVAEVMAFRKQQAEAVAGSNAKQQAEQEAEQKAEKQRAQAARQAAMKQLLAKKPALGQEPVYQGIPLSSWVDKVGQIEEYNGAPADAVAAIRAIGSNAVPFLLEWMPHPGAVKPVEGFPDWSDVNISWWALGEQGKSAIPVLARNINQPRHTMDDYSVWTESAKAISFLGPDAIEPMLNAATNLAGQHELWELLHNFQNLGTNGASAVPALIHWAEDPDYWVRDGVVSALGGIGKRPDLAVSVLLRALAQDTNSMVRRDAAEALGAFANDSAAVLPALTNALKSPDWETRGGALSGLGKIQDKPEVVVPLIAEFLHDDNNVLQRTAAYALRDLGSAAGYQALLQASNAPSSGAGIGDIIYQVQEKMQQSKSH